MNSESLPIKNDSESKIKERIQTLLQTHPYEEALPSILHEKYFKHLIKETQETYISDLEQAQFLTCEDWERLTIMHVFSPELVQHCIETYKLARLKIEEILLGEHTLAEIIESEQVTLEIFYRACLFHDIGKVTIPKSVLNYNIKPGDWLALVQAVQKDHPDQSVLEHLGLHKQPITPETIEYILHSAYINPINTLSASALLTHSEVTELRNKGISPDLTLRDILELHEPASRKLLQKDGLYIEADIAGQHHNYKQEPYQYPITSKTIGISADFSDLLRLADEEDALLSKRSYKEPFSLLTVLEILMHDAKQGAINKTLTALWIQHELNTNNPIIHTQEDAQKLDSIQLFIDECCKKHQSVDNL